MIMSLHLHFLKIVKIDVSTCLLASCVFICHVSGHPLPVLSVRIFPDYLRILEIASERSSPKPTKFYAWLCFNISFLVVLYVFSVKCVKRLSLRNTLILGLPFTVRNSVVWSYLHERTSVLYVSRAG